MTALFATQMFDKLGVDWAGSLLGFLGVAFLPIPFLFYIYGERLRRMSKYAPTNLGNNKENEDEESRGQDDDTENSTGEGTEAEKREEEIESDNDTAV